jgi:glycosyltransferase involved in cell wall biosynthesis
LIGSDIASIAELVGAGAGGFTVAAGDVAAWRDALVRVAAPAARADLLARGVAARKTAERLFDQRNYARKLVEMYREIATLPR